MTILWETDVPKEEDSEKKGRRSERKRGMVDFPQKRSSTSPCGRGGSSGGRREKRELHQKKKKGEEKNLIPSRRALDLIEGGGRIFSKKRITISEGSILPEKETTTY